MYNWSYVTSFTDYRVVHSAWERVFLHGVREVEYHNLNNKESTKTTREERRRRNLLNTRDTDLTKEPGEE